MQKGSHDPDDARGAPGGHIRRPNARHVRRNVHVCRKRGQRVEGRLVFHFLQEQSVTNVQRFAKKTV